MATQNYTLNTTLNGLSSLKEPIGYTTDNTGTNVTGVTELNMLSFDGINFQLAGTQSNGNPNILTNLYGGILGVTIYGFGLDTLPLIITTSANKNNSNYNFQY